MAAAAWLLLDADGFRGAGDHVAEAGLSPGLAREVLPEHGFRVTVHS
jgi:hypothetical protein